MIGILRCAAMLAIVTAALTAPAHAETLLQRGTYLMRSIVACGNCHTPKGPKGDIPGMELAGMAPMAKEPGFTANAPNITPDRETGIGTWTDAQIITAIREGRRPNGKIIGPPMPIALYRGLSDRDAKAIVAYLRTVKPIKNAIPDFVYDIHLPPAYGPPVESVADVPESDKLAYGAYLAGPAGHCIECHSPMGERGPDIQNNLGAGGFEFHGPWGVSVSANITPTGLQDRTDAQIKTMITKGLRPDGSPLMPPMAYAYYANIKDRDLDAIIAYLRALPAK
jgi:mono/diheme cytochrome c family protein